MSDKIHVDTSRFDTWSQKLGYAADDVKDVRSVLSQIDTGEEWWGQLSGIHFNAKMHDGKSFSATGARDAMRTIKNALSCYADALDEVSANVKKAKERFNQAERDISARASMITDNAECPDHGVGNADVNYSTGATTADSSTESWWSALWNDYQNKGTSYRVVNGVASIAKIVGGVGTIVLAVGGELASVGVSTPVSVVMTVYAANEIANSSADLYNCIFGDVDKVGETNLLKSGSTWVCGMAGEALGNREAGEAVGKVLYHGGEAVNIVGNAQVAINGITHVATHASTF